MAGWGTFFGKIAEQFQGRIERLKNEKERLINERDVLLSKDFSATAARRVPVINERLAKIDIALTTKASD